MQEFQFLTPKSRHEACIMLNETRGRHCMVAGGTDAVLMMNSGKVSAEYVINLKGLKELDYILVDEKQVHIGALTTFSVIAGNTYMEKNVKVLYEACRHIGSPQIRNAATIGGNLVNGSVAGDGIAACLTLDAVVVLECIRGIRRLPLRQFYDEEKGRCIIADDELLTEVCFKKPGEGTVSGFFKLGKRNSLAIVDIGAGVLAEADDENNCTHIRLIGGALARFPLQFTEAEQYMLGRKLTRENLMGCMEYLHDAVYESIKSRPDEVYYKKESVKGAFEMMFEEIIRQNISKGFAA